MRAPKPKMVRFDVYCKTCEYKDLREIESPCDECLDTPVREGTAEPEKYKEGV